MPLTTSDRSPEVWGVVRDARTDSPVEGARVSVHEYGSVQAQTDSTGSFHLKGTRNHHLFTLLGICSTDFPEGKRYDDRLDICRTGYRPLQIKAHEYVSAEEAKAGKSPLHLRDVLLTPDSE